MDRELIATDSEQEERIMTFIESMDVGNTPFLRDVEKEALGLGIPIIRTQTQSLIKFILELKHPKNILEVGAATGFSSLFMLTYAEADARITTIERDEERIAKARENYSRAAASGDEKTCDALERITLLTGDATEILADLQGSYDLIFMDAAKGQYINFLPEIMRLLAPGGILLSDNVFKDGEILQSRFAVKRRDRTIHKRMRAYLDALRTDDRLQTMLLQEGDGAAISVKKY